MHLFTWCKKVISWVILIILTSWVAHSWKKISLPLGLAAVPLPVPLGSLPLLLIRLQEFLLFLGWVWCYAPIDWKCLESILVPTYRDKNCGKKPLGVLRMHLHLSRPQRRVPVLGRQRHGASETLRKSPDNVFCRFVFSVCLFVRFLFWSVCWGWGQGFAFILCVSQVNNVILDSLPCQQVLC